MKRDERPYIPVTYGPGRKVVGVASVQNGWIVECDLDEPVTVSHVQIHRFVDTKAVSSIHLSNEVA